jgi:dipeptidyl aminopeptidase/acylaminoacyl peptidase
MSQFAASSTIDPENVVLTELIGGKQVELMYVEVWDGLYTAIGMRRPEGPGPFPVVLLASGNGGEGMRWVRDAMQNRGYTIDRLVEAGFACAWLRYRTEVELGYQGGGKLVRDKRQGREMFNRAPLEYEDEIAIIEYVKHLPYVDPDRIGLIGLSHGGEMILKLTSEYHGVAAAVASEPAAHEFLALTPDETAFINAETGLRDIENMNMADTEKVRRRIDMPLALARIASISTPILVMGRDDDHLQGIFRTSFDLLKDAGKDVEWVSYDHELHGYVYPMRGADGAYEVNDVQVDAIHTVIAYLSRYLRP